MSRQDVIVEPITDISDLVWWKSNQVDQLVEELSRRLFDPQAGRGRDEVGVQPARLERFVGAMWLIARDTDQDSGGTQPRKTRQSIRIMVLWLDPICSPGCGQARLDARDIHARGGEVEDTAMMLATLDNGTEGSEEREARDAEPIRPDTPLARFVDQCLADVEDDSPGSNRCPKSRLRSRVCRKCTPDLNGRLRRIELRCVDFNIVGAVHMDDTVLSARLTNPAVCSGNFRRSASEIGQWTPTSVRSIPASTICQSSSSHGSNRTSSTITFSPASATARTAR